MLRKLVLLFLLIFAFKGCTRDDICPAGTPTTPQLIITFNDVINPEIPKRVIGLSIETDYENSILVLARQDTDSIAIPLNMASDTTKYRFIRTTISAQDTIVNIDRLQFIYQRNNNYVNRACGFKTQFENLTADLEEEGSGNWIQNILVVRDTIQDENKAHITILH